MKKKLLYIIGFTLIIYILTQLNWSEMIYNIGQLNRSVLFLLCSLQIITIFAIAIQWKFMVKLTGRNTSILNVLRVNLRGNIVDAITPGVKVGGEIARVHQVSKVLAIDYSNSLLVVGLQKTLSLITFLFLTLLSFIWFNISMSREYILLNILFLIGIILLTTVFSLLIFICIKPKSVEFIFKPIPNTFKYKDKIMETSIGYGRLIRSLVSRPSYFISQLILGIFIWTLFGLKMYILVGAFNLDINILNVFAITYLTYILGMIPFLPGSIGSFEAGMITLFTIVNVEIEIATLIAIVFRFITFWFEFLLSLVFVGIDGCLLKIKEGEKFAKCKI